MRIVMERSPASWSADMGCALQKKRNVCSTSQWNHVKGSSRQLCDIPQLGHHLMHEMLWQWRGRHVMRTNESQLSLLESILESWLVLSARKTGSSRKPLLYRSAPH